MKSILITIAISVYMTFTVVTTQMANRQTVITSDVTLDLVDIMTKAFDMSEGGESSCPPFGPDVFNHETQCTGGYAPCTVIFYLNGQVVPLANPWDWIFPGFHEMPYVYNCIPDVIVNPCYCTCGPELGYVDPPCEECCPPGGPAF